MPVAIIGAGPAGLTAAYTLKSLWSVDLYEAGSCIGGLAKSSRFLGQIVDLGPHRFFSRDRQVNELWLKVVERDYAMVRRLTRILYRGQLYQYPLRAFDVLAKLGPLEAARCLTSYAGQRLQRTDCDNGSFEHWVCSRFGRRLFEIFFKSYSEKLWGIPCDELDADFAAQRIKQFSLSAAVKNTFFRNGEHRTLVDEFAYPTGGTGMVYERMAEAIRKNGGRVFLNTPVQRVLTERGQVKGFELSDGTEHEYDHVISTMPLTQLVMRLPESPSHVIEAAKQLKFRNTILVYLEIADPNICPDQWIYVHSPELRTGRITNFRNWVPQLYGDSNNTILAMEYWCNDADDLWRKPDEELIFLARRELVATTLVKDESLVLNGFVYRIPKCYPVYRRGYKELLRPIREYLSGIQGLQVIGRYGSFKYNNQDHSILMGILAAENIIENAGHDLWSVNADYDTYQEGWKITETGLMPMRQPAPAPRAGAAS